MVYEKTKVKDFMKGIDMNIQSLGVPIALNAADLIDQLNHFNNDSDLKIVGA